MSPPARAPTNVQARGSRGRALRFLGRRAEALAAYRTGLALRPDDPSLRRWLREVEAGG